MRFQKLTNSMRRSSDGLEAVRQALIDEVEKSVYVIDRLDDLTFAAANKSSSVGAQFRHCLDYLNTFVDGVAVGRIDYTRRERDTRAEFDRGYAVERFDIAMRRLSSLTERQLRSIVSVVSEIDPTMWLPSTAMREMEFVLSHTIHHQALIAEKLSQRGIQLDMTLGVAMSTRNYWNQMAA